MKLRDVTIPRVGTREPSVALRTCMVLPLGMPRPMSTKMGELSKGRCAAGEGTLHSRLGSARGCSIVYGVVRSCITSCGRSSGAVERSAVWARADVGHIFMVPQDGGSRKGSVPALLTHAAGVQPAGPRGSGARRGDGSACQNPTLDVGPRSPSRYTTRRGRWPR